MAKIPFHNIVEEAELNDRINKSINLLPEKCRVIFIMSRYESLKYNEIANKLNKGEIEPLDEREQYK